MLSTAFLGARAHLSPARWPAVSELHRSSGPQGLHMHSPFFLSPHIHFQGDWAWAGSRHSEILWLMKCWSPSILNPLLSQPHHGLSSFPCGVLLSLPGPQIFISLAIKCLLASTLHSCVSEPPHVDTIWDHSQKSTESPSITMNVKCIS